ncbi:MAG: protein translocase subunit SecD, partial [Planctomycetota bacterium]
IDLRGGVEFTCRLYNRDNEVVAADEVVVDILRRRLDARGLTEPQVFRLTSGDIQVVIPGGTQADAARTRKVLETTGRLEIREVKADIRVTPGLVELTRPGEEPVRLQPAQAGELLKQNPNGTWDFGADYSDHLSRAPFVDVIYPKKTAPGAEPTEFIHLGTVVLTGADVDSAFPTFGNNGGPAVGITFKAAGGETNRVFTTDVKAKGDTGVGTGRISISMDGVVESDPRVVSPSGRNTVIEGRFTDEEVDSLRTVLVAGALSVTPRVTSERVVGPSLGAETIERGATSMLWGLAVILVMMLGYYRLRIGSVAIASLVTTIGLVFVVLSIFGATLTLPGLAGLVLTVGMAVDANILIFERLREELTEDVDLATGISNGYSRAFITILDASLTTFITALILYLIGSGPVKGFGLTLMIGITTSMFGAIYVGRLVTEWWYRGKTSAVIPSLLKPVALRYTSMRWPALALSVLILVGSWAAFLGKDGGVDNNYDIDFTGGNMVQVTFVEKLTNDQVRTALEQASAGDRDHLLAPSNVQLLPYFADFGEAGEGSRQWMFKGRDLAGASIERERAAAEDKLAEAHRAIDELSMEDNELKVNSKPPVNEAAIAELRSQLAGYDATVVELTAKVEERQAAFRGELAAAFAGKLKAEGSEIRAVAWDDATVTLDLALLAAANAEQLAAIEARMSEKGRFDDLAAEHVEGDDQTLRLRVGYPAAPAAVERLQRDDAIVARMAELLGSEDAAARGRVIQAAHVYDQIVDAVATAGLNVDQPFPSSQHFSPLVGDQMKTTSMIAMMVAVLCILAYIAARFEMRYGVGAIVALAHDVLITIGLLAVFDLRIDLTVIAALLTIIGYSLNDTIVVFDRIRENIGKIAKGLAEVIDLSIAHTMSRTLLTSTTTLAVVAILFFWGGEGVHAFSGTLLIGLLLGT